MDPRILVMKFGGTSVGTPEAMAQAVQIVPAGREIWPRLVVVTSALSGVTDLLLESARRAVRGELEAVEPAAGELRQRHLADASLAWCREEALRQAAEGRWNGWSAILASCARPIAVLGEATPRALDAVATLGERLCVRRCWPPPWLRRASPPKRWKPPA